MKTNDIKNIRFITIFSLLACGLHALILHTPFNHYAVTSAFKVFVFMSAPILYFLISKDGRFKDIATLKGDNKNIKIALIIGASAFVFIQVLFVALRQFLDETMIVDALADNGITGGNFPLVFIYIVLINAALEQIFFRGFIFLTIHRKGFKLYAHVYSAALFALYHVAFLYSAMSLGMLVFLTFGLVVAGLIFNYFALVCRSISGSLIIHIGANVSLNLIVTMYLYA